MVVDTDNNYKWHLVTVNKIRGVECDNIMEFFVYSFTMRMDPQDVSQSAFIINTDGMKKFPLLSLHPDKQLSN